MTDGHLVSHAFQLSHSLPSSRAWSSLDDSGTDESAPSLTAPFPTIPHPPSFELSAASDSALSVTPERMVSSRVPLHHPVSSVPEDNCEPKLRASKVHFDQTVSVRHLSPEYSCNNESADDYWLSELDTDVLSSMYREVNTSDVEPISIIASDLRSFSPSSMSLLCALESDRKVQHNRADGKILSGKDTRKKKFKCSSNQSMQVVMDLGNTGGIQAGSGHNCLVDDAECVLAKPDFNSTLKMSNEISQLQEQQFDLVAVAKGKINPKLKQQLFEKVLL